MLKVSLFLADLLVMDQQAEGAVPKYANLQIQRLGQVPTLQNATANLFRGLTLARLDLRRLLAVSILSLEDLNRCLVQTSITWQV